MLNARSTETFLNNLRHGLEAEELFGHEIARMGGYAFPFGPQPFSQGMDRQHLRCEVTHNLLPEDQQHRAFKGPDTPMACFWGREEKPAHFTSPDMLIDLPEGAAMVQLKAKRLQQTGSPEEHFIIDHVEKALMEEAGQMFIPTLFVVFCPELAYRPGLSPFSFVPVSQLHPDVTQLHRRMVKDKSVFVLPTRLFRAFNQTNLRSLFDGTTNPTRSCGDRRTRIDRRDAGSPRPQSDGRSGGTGHSHRDPLAEMPPLRDQRK